MRVLLAPDSFKESMTAAQAAAAMARGVRRVWPNARCEASPLADGGEGFSRIIGLSLGARMVSVPVADARRHPRPAALAWLAADGLAVLDAAAAVGLEHVPLSERDVMTSSSDGVGDLIAAALELGPRRIVVGLGGSATVDGGTGMLRALGARFMDTAGNELAPGPAGLQALAAVDLSQLDPRLRSCEMVVGADVRNPLLGPDGASRVFGPQKGASSSQVHMIEAALDRLVTLTRTEAAAALPGAGAAGGLGYALAAFLGAAISPGIDLLLEATGVAERIGEFDYVFTGEGSIDGQTLHGKAVLGLARHAQRAGTPLVAFAGRLGTGAAALLDAGVDRLVPICDADLERTNALRSGPVNLERAVATVCRELAGVHPARHGVRGAGRDQHPDDQESAVN